MNSQVRFWMLQLRKGVVLWFCSMLFGIALAPARSYAASWSGIIAPTRATDWSVAGAGAIPPRLTICSTMTTANTISQINAAIQNCPVGQTVKMNAGTYTFSGEFIMKSGVTLRGAGADQTIVVFSGGGGQCNLPG